MRLASLIGARETVRDLVNGGMAGVSPPQGLSLSNLLATLLRLWQPLQGGP